MKVGTLQYAYLNVRAAGFQASAPGLAAPSDGWSPGCTCEGAPGTGPQELLRGLESWAQEPAGNVFGTLMSLVGSLLGSLGLGSPQGLPGFGNFAGGDPSGDFGTTSPGFGGASPSGDSSFGGVSRPGSSGGTPSSEAPAALPGATAPGTTAGDDPALASRIDDYLAGQGSPAAGQGAGDLMTRWGQEYDVDPMLLLAIAGHETGFGKLGVGMDKMLGVGAFDDNPDGQTHFNGLSTQIEVGAKTFANLREQGGAGPDSSIEDQLRAAGQKWATDPNWANGVMRHYQQIREAMG